MTCSSDPLDDSCVGMECKCSALNEARTCTMFSVRNSTRQRPPVFEQCQARTSQWDGSLAQSAWQLTLLVKTMWVVMSFHGEDSFSLTAQDQITRQGVPDGNSQRDESRRGVSPDIWKTGSQGQWKEDRFGRQHPKVLSEQDDLPHR